jgi:hypothetical protein
MEEPSGEAVADQEVQGAVEPDLRQAARAAQRIAARRRPARASTARPSTARPRPRSSRASCRSGRRRWEEPSGEAVADQEVQGAVEPDLRQAARAAQRIARDGRRVHDGPASFRAVAGTPEAGESIDGETFDGETEAAMFRARSSRICGRRPGRPSASRGTAGGRKRGKRSEPGVTAPSNRGA